MNVQFTARNFELTESIKEVVTAKLGKFQKFMKEQPIYVTMETNKRGQKIEIMFFVDGSLLKAEESDKDLYVAIDLVMDILKKQLNKFAHKKPNKFHDTLRHHQEPSVMYELDEDDEEEAGKITKRKQFTMKPMMEDEAVLQMEMLGHKTFMFFNGETNSMCLLYKRKDGCYGIIESTY